MRLFGSNFFLKDATGKHQTGIAKEKMSLSTQRNQVADRRDEYDAFLADPLSAIIESFFSAERGTRMANKFHGWAGDLKLDSVETKDAFLISVDLPGVLKEDIKVSLSRDGVLSIDAERREFFSTMSDDEAIKSHWKERMFGRMRRSIRLPKSANSDDYKCRFDNGVLDIRIGKKDPQTDTNYLQIE